MNSDGSGVVQLTDNGAQDWWPSFSPDGTQIAFSSDRDGNREIYTMNADGTAQTNRSNHPTEDDNADWGSNGKITFASRRAAGETDIFVMEADGTGMTRLTTDPSADYAPAWSDDASRIAFIRGGGTSAEVYNMAADGSDVIRVTNNSVAEGGSLAWSPDGSQIVFSRGGGNSTEVYAANAVGGGEIRLTNNAFQDTAGDWGFRVLERIVFSRFSGGIEEIYVMNSDGSGQTRLTNNGVADGEPSWSPDGSRIALRSTKDGNQEIYTMDAKFGSTQTRLTFDATIDANPVWSPDDTLIAFISLPEPCCTAIYVMNTNGTGRTRLPGSPDDRAPSWSPDSARIAFSRHHGGGNWEVYVMDRDGANQIRLTDDPSEDFAYGWSPDGKQILFTSTRDGGDTDIYVMNQDGSNQTPLTSNSAADAVARWSPDGNYIVFMSDRDGNNEIYRMQANGSNPVRLTNDPASDAGPDWGPPPATNSLPTVDAGGSYSVAEGSAVEVIASGSDPDGDPITFAWDLDGDEIYETPGQSATFSAAALDGPSVHTISVQVTDSGGLSATDQAVVNVSNVAPQAVLGNSGPVDEGSPATISFSNQSDPSVVDTAAGFHYSFACDNSPLTGATYLDSGTSASTNCTFSDNGSFPVRARIIDKDDGFTEYQSIVTVNNVAPTVGPITAPLDPVQVNTLINTSASFTDPGIADTHTAVWDWGDNTTSAGTVTETGGSGSVSGSYSYPAAGVYTLTLTVTDDDLDAGQSVFQFVVVYDPEGGFVTGGGWIDSPLGAYVADPSLTGKANFGFVSKYKKGANTPTGQTQFQFKLANLNFHSSSYDWLVIAGARAHFKGTGTINGLGDYGFMLVGIDGDVNGGGGTDKFRIKIWDKSNGDAVVYDNQLGDADDGEVTTVLGGGSIVVHDK